MSPVQMLLWLLTLLAAVASGVQVSYATHTIRRLNVTLEEALRAQDEALARNSRLLLERSALAAYQNVEHTAQTELQMRFPVAVERVAQ